MTRKTFIIDTNVLLHDPEAIHQFRDSDVVIPVIVLEELDTMKRFSDERGKNGRRVMRYIDSIKSLDSGNLKTGVPLDKGIRVRIHVEINSQERKGFPLQLDQTSNKLLLIAFLLKERGETIVLVSKDFVTRVKAEAIGIEAQDYENLKFSYDKLYKGYRTIEVPKKEIDLFYKDGSISLNVKNFAQNEYCIMTSPEKSSAIAKYNAETKKLEPLLKLNRDVWGILPRNTEQKCALDLLLRDNIKLVTLVGPAGTGKTLLALAAALRKVFDEGVYTKILVSRPIVPLGKDIGYLPGTKEEKLYHWMQPIYDNLEFLCSSKTGSANGADAEEWIVKGKKFEMEALTYIRGRSLPKMFIIIDEAQNLTPHEIKTIASRVGEDTKIVFTGDATQIDNPYLDENSNGLTYLASKMQEYDIYGHTFLYRTERSKVAAIAADVL